MDLSTFNILIVDDNTKNLQVVGQILREKNAGLSLATSGEGGLEILKKIKPDLILLDIMMPGLDGYQTCQRIKENDEWADIPVIFLTARGEAADIVNGFQAGGVDYIVKPFNRDELLVRVNNQLELYSARDKILKMNTFRDKLFSIIAHDIRSPMSGILQTITTISEGYLTRDEEDFGEIVEALRQRTSSTLELLNNLLEWTRNQSAANLDEFRKISLGEILEPALSICSTQIQDKEQRIVLEYDQDHWVFGDCKSLTTVFRNILSNACKFTPKGGQITVSSSMDSKSTSVFITDTGVGISEEKLGEILGEGKVVSTRGTNSESGTGFGLVVIRDFLQLNKGVFHIESKPQNGTRVSVRLPLRK